MIGLRLYARLLVFGGPSELSDLGETPLVAVYIQFVLQVEIQEERLLGFKLRELSEPRLPVFSRPFGGQRLLLLYHLVQTPLETVTSRSTMSKNTREQWTRPRTSSRCAPTVTPWPPRGEPP